MKFKVTVAATAENVTPDSDGDIEVTFEKFGTYWMPAGIVSVERPELKAGQVWAGEENEKYLVTLDRWGELGVRTPTDSFISADNFNVDEYRLVEENA